MRREGQAAAQGLRSQRLKLRPSLLRALHKKLEERARRRMLLRQSSAYKPSCTKLEGFRLKGDTPVLFKAGTSVENCIAGCRPRANLAKNRTASASSAEGESAAANALDGNAETEYVSSKQKNPWWQVDLGESKTIGDVYISSSKAMKDVQVGLRDEACAQESSDSDSSDSSDSSSEGGDSESGDGDGGGEDGSGDDGDGEGGGDDGGEGGSGDESGEEGQSDEAGGGGDEEAQLLELAGASSPRSLSGRKARKTACDFKHSCGALGEDDKFVSCKGLQGRFLVVQKSGTGKTLTIGEVEVWEDASLSRNSAVATMSPEKKVGDNHAKWVLDDKPKTTAVSKAAENPWIQVELAGEESNIGKVTLYPEPGNRKEFAPTEKEPVKVGVSDKTCSSDESTGKPVSPGCMASEKSFQCGLLTEKKEAGPYIVDCGGKTGKFVWVELPGKGRNIHLGSIEVEKAALCEQVVFEQPKSGPPKCYHFDKYSAVESTAKVEGTTYTSAICHPAGKVGPAGPTGAKGDKGLQGLPGPAGKAGPKGDAGDAGAIGEPGEVGEPGPEGKEADVTGLATMGQLNGAGGLCLLITIAILVILLQKVSPKKKKEAGPSEEQQGEGEEGGFEGEAVEGEEEGGYEEGEEGAQQ